MKKVMLCVESFFLRCFELECESSGLHSFSAVRSAYQIDLYKSSNFETWVLLQLPPCFSVTMYLSLLESFLTKALTAKLIIVVWVDVITKGEWRERSDAMDLYL